MTYSLPSRYVTLPVEILKQAIKPDKPHEGLFLTFVQLLALAWDNEYNQTPRLHEEEMYNTKNPDGSIHYGYLKISRREYFVRKREMELLGWLRSTRPATGFVQFSFDRAITDAISAQTSTKVHERALEEVRGGESINLNLNTDSPLPPLKEEASAQTCTIPGVKEILYHADKLFDGATISTKDIEDRDPLYALAWCAYAYRERSKLTGPGGLVRNRLLDNQAPPEWAKQQWQETLPCDFLEALGLIEYTCQECGATFKKMIDLEAHEATHPKVYACSACDQTYTSEEDLDAHYDLEHRPAGTQISARIWTDESVRQPIRDGASLTPEQAWQAVLGQLQMEMPRASFETWVRDTKAIRYGRNTLTIGVRNAYAREWLESRLASTVSRLLVGIMNDSVTAEFVVAEEVEP